MTEYQDLNGKKFTDGDVERWASEAESGKGFDGKRLGPAVVGRPIRAELMDEM
ncbi:hypothetical protein [Bowdeniella nasicola]|uniref:hypothetical protein n=1 Tax=Bowdeniella nasicola TaxID=208480 RepID=UPI00130156B1|nr:hypothetical protein [Bowdeniella nasicola]